MILSSLKLRRETNLVRSADLENPNRPACEKKLRLYYYALHKSIVTIGSFCVALGFFAPSCLRPWVRRALVVRLRSTWIGLCCELLQQHSQGFYCELILFNNWCCVIPFGLVLYPYCWMDKLSIEILGKLIHFGRTKLNSVAL